jgi:hypothetical protein
MQNNLNDMLQKEVSRREFLRNLGIGVVSLLGLSALLKLAGHHGHHLTASRGYGSSPYGR